LASKRAARQRIARYGFTALMAVALSIVMVLPGLSVLTRMGEDLTLPFIAKAERPASPVALIVIDEATHRSPPFSETPEVAWTPRIAAVLNAVGAAGPQVVGLDMVYPTSLDSPAFLPGFDKPLLEAFASLGRANRLVLAEVRFSDQTLTPYPAQKIAAGEDNIRPVTMAPDADGVIRSYPVTAPREFGEGVETFAAEVAERAGRKPTRPFLIDFRRPASEIPAFRLSDLHHCLEAGDLRPFDSFKGKVVLVGVSLDVEDRHRAANRFTADNQPKVRSLACGPATAATTPKRATTPGLLIHAHAVDTVMRASAPAPIGAMGGAALSFVLFLGLGAVYASFRKGIGLVALVLFAGGVFALAVFALGGGTLTPWPQWIIGGIVLFAAVYAFRFRVEERVKRELARSFGRNLSPSLVQLLAEDPKSVKLGGEHRQAAVMFTDLEGFTGFAERNADNPEKIVAKLNALFARINDIIEDHGGYVDKFVGDGLMAVWGAPLPNAKPAAAAAKAALAISDAFDAMAIQAAAQDETPMRIRIGLSFGTVLAGNIGAARRFDYTVLGDPPNRAARLQEACKTYDVGVLADGEFVGALDGAFEARMVARAVLRGSSETIEVWTVLRPSSGEGGA